MRDAVIFDMDGTLCDTSSILHFVQGEDRDYHAFHAASADCPPHPEIVDAARARHADGLAVLVVSSREFIWRDLTLDWLTEHDVPYDELYLRFVGDYREDVVVKREILARIAEEGYRVVEAWDDKPSVLELWREHGIEVHAVGTGEESVT